VGVVTFLELVAAAIAGASAAFCIGVWRITPRLTSMATAPAPIAANPTIVT
jgi:hypothetical protein